VGFIANLVQFWINFVEMKILNSMLILISLNGTNRNQVASTGDLMVYDVRASLSLSLRANASALKIPLPSDRKLTKIFVHLC
jgi:hypothetical protein